MKNLFLLVFVLLFSVSFSFSQAKTPEEQAKDFTSKLNHELVLNGQQARKLNNLLIKSFVEADKIRNNASLAKDARKVQLKQIYAERKAGMDAIFTAEQKAKYEAYILSRKTK